MFLYKKYLLIHSGWDNVICFVYIITDLVVKILDFQSKGPLGGTKVDSSFHPSKVDEMSDRNFLEFSD